MKLNKMAGLTLGIFFTLLMLTMPVHAFWGGDKFKQEVEKEQGAVKLVREVQQGGYDLVTTAELKQWMDEKKQMLIIDTMPYEASYKKAHVPGAAQFLFPIPDMNEWDTQETDGKTKAEYEALLGPDKDKVIVVYCGFVKCTRSHNGAWWAKKLGYQKVYRYTGGIYAWKGAGYPAEAE
jgi:rhodanese-related sulfurtransferase